MNKTALYQDQLARLQAADIFSPDFPDETVETTLKALWCTVSGKPCSAATAREAKLDKLSDQQELELQDLVKKRISGVPLAHLTGKTNFLGLELISTPDVLVPRAETELLAHAVLDRFCNQSHQNEPLTGIDVGCGSGNLTCAITAGISNCRIFAIDLTEACVDLTLKNIRHTGFEKRVEVYQGDLFSPLSGFRLENRVDFIISNPPYIPSSKLQKDLSHLVMHEPEAAFNGGIYGFAIHQRLLKDSLLFLKPGGYLFFEFGIGQDKQIEALCRRIKGYTDVEFRNDQRGVPRVAVLCKIAENLQ